MLRRLRRRLTYANVISTLALFFALAGGTAVALDGSNTVFGDDITDNQVSSADVRDDNLGFGGLAARDLGPNSVASSEIVSGGVTSSEISPFTINEGDIAPNGVNGQNVNEGSLETVPSAVLGGLGRDGVNSSGSRPGFCDPQSFTFINCNIAATLVLPRPARVLMIGSVLASSNSPRAEGECQLGTTSGAIPGSDVFIRVQDNNPNGFNEVEHVAVSGVTGVFPAGQHSFGVDCNQTLGDIGYIESRVTAVALSDQ